VRHAPAGLGLRLDDPVDADPLQDVGVLGGERLGPDHGYAGVDEVHGAQHRGLHGGADAHDGDLVQPGLEVDDRLRGAGVRLDHLPDLAEEGLGQHRVPLDRHHMVTEPLQLDRRRPAEPAETDDQHVVLVELPGHSVLRVVEVDVQPPDATASPLLGLSCPRRRPGR
jgi:hypothetical protein